MALFASPPDHRPAEPSLVCRRHVHPDAPRLFVLGRHHGLVQPQGSGVAAVEHDGCRLCVTALEQAIAGFGRPEIFNTDQGSQFTSFAFTNTLQQTGIRVSMDGRGRWMDNVFIERLWQSLKYECVYLNAFESGSEARTRIGRWVAYYNADRPHSAFNGRTPDEVYATQETEEKLAA